MIEAHEEGSTNAPSKGFPSDLLVKTSNLSRGVSLYILFTDRRISSSHLEGRNCKEEEILNKLFTTKHAYSI